MMNRQSDDVRLKVNPLKGIHCLGLGFEHVMEDDYYYYYYYCSVRLKIVIRKMGVGGVIDNGRTGDDDGFVANVMWVVDRMKGTLPMMNHRDGVRVVVGDLVKDIVQIQVDQADVGVGCFVKVLLLDTMDYYYYYLDAREDIQDRVDASR